MNISLLRVQFRLAGCKSLKEKRSRLAPLRGKLGKRENIALCETGFRDEKSQAQWAFVVLTKNAKDLDKAINGIEATLQQLDAIVTDIRRESI